MLIRVPFNGEPGSKWLFSFEGETELREVSLFEGFEYLRRGRSRHRPLPDLPILPPFGGTKILCVGRNYKPHAQELGNPLPKEPLWFAKPPSALVGNLGTVVIPEGFGRIDYEGEVAVVIGTRCRHVSSEAAGTCIGGVTLALDITARDLQKADGQWTRAKGFDTFCPLGPAILPFTEEWLDMPFVTELNGNQVQSDRTSSMIFTIPDLISHISACMTLEPGDIILTGTPAGVGPLKPGDRLRVGTEGPRPLSLEVVVA